MRLNFNEVIKLIIRGSIVFGVFGIVIPLFSLLSTKNLYEQITASTKDEHDREFPTILRYPRALDGSFTKSNGSCSSLQFAFPLSMLTENIKYGLPEIEIFFSAGNSNEPRCENSYSIEVLEHLQLFDGTDVVQLRENIVSIDPTVGHNYEYPLLQKLWHFFIPDTSKLNGQIIQKHITKSAYTVKVEPSNTGNVLLENPPAYIDTQRDAYVLDIVLRYANEGKDSFTIEKCGPPLLTVFDKSNLKLCQDQKQMNGIKKFMMNYKITSLLALFGLHYFLLSSSIMFSTTIFGFVL